MEQLKKYTLPEEVDYEKVKGFELRCPYNLGKFLDLVNFYSYSLSDRKILSAIKFKFKCLVVHK